jgi:hypothetical protein
MMDRSGKPIGGKNLPKPDPDQVSSRSSLAARPGGS